MLLIQQLLIVFFLIWINSFFFLFLNRDCVVVDSGGQTVNSIKTVASARLLVQLYLKGTRLQLFAAVIIKIWKCLHVGTLWLYNQSAVLHVEQTKIKLIFASFFMAPINRDNNSIFVSLQRADRRIHGLLCFHINSSFSTVSNVFCQSNNKDRQTWCLLDRPVLNVQNKFPN